MPCFLASSHLLVFFFVVMSLSFFRVPLRVQVVCGSSRKFLRDRLYILRLLRASKLCRLNSLILRIQFSCTLRDGL